MAAFTINGMDELARSMAELASLSDEDVMAVLTPAAELLEERQRQYLSAHHSRTGALAASVTTHPYPSQHAIDVGPESGAAKRRSGKGRTTVRAAHKGSGGVSTSSSHHGSKTTSTMEEVAYYLHYGTRRMEATGWLDKVMEQSEADVISAEGAAFDAILKSKGL